MRSFRGMLASVVAFGAMSGQTIAAEPIRIGSFLSVTGQGAFLGDPSKKTLEMVVGDINARGGVDGRKIELVVYDTGTSAKEATTFVKRLIEQDKVDLIIGGNTTGETMAVAQQVEQAGVPLIALAGGTPVVEPVKKWIFKTPHTDRLSVSRVFQHVRKSGKTKVGLLSGSGGYDKSCRDNALVLAKPAGIELVADETHGTGDSDMTAQLTKIRAAKAEALLYCGFGTPTSIVAKNQRQLGFDIPAYQTIGSASEKFIEGAAGGAEGSLVTASPIIFADQLPPTDRQKTVASALSAEYRTRMKAEPDLYVGYAYDAMSLAVDAIRRAGGTDKAKLREALEKTRDFIGVTGIYTMSATDHMGLDESSLRIVQVKNGKFVLVD